MTTPAPDSFEQARQRMHAQAEEGRQRRDALRDTAAAVRAATATARSTDGTVSVTAGAEGAVTDITVTDGALESTPEELGRVLTETVRAAQRAALERAAAAAAEQLGENH